MCLLFNWGKFIINLIHVLNLKSKTRLCDLISLIFARIHIIKIIENLLHSSCLGAHFSL